MDERFIEKDYDIRLIISHIRLLADVAAPSGENLDIKADDLAYVLGNLADKLEKTIYEK